MTLRSTGVREGRNPRVRQTFLVQRRFFWIIVGETMGGQKAIRRDAQGGMVMEAAPVAAFVMRQAELLLQFPIVALDAPAHLGNEDQLFQRGVGWQPSPASNRPVRRRPAATRSATTLPGAWSSPDDSDAPDGRADR